MAKFIKTPAGDLVLVLSAAEARGLSVLASQGEAGLIGDCAALRGYLGPPASQAAAWRALATLADACGSVWRP